MTTPTRRMKIPRDTEHDYTPEAAEARRAFLREQTGVGLKHLSRYSFDPSILPGNVENFTGVATVSVVLSRAAQPATATLHTPAISPTRHAPRIIARISRRPQ